LGLTPVTAVRFVEVITTAKVCKFIVRQRGEITCKVGSMIFTLALNELRGAREDDQLTIPNQEENKHCHFQPRGPQGRGQKLAVNPSGFTQSYSLSVPPRRIRLLRKAETVPQRLKPR
jgi:hypothetical protein